MKFVISLVVVMLNVAFMHANPTPEQMEKIKAAMEVCKPKVGATEADIQTLMKHETPDSKTGQCFIACMNKEFGVMNADNKIDVARITELSAPLKDKDADKYEKGMKVIETCAGEANAESDECDVAKKMMDCSRKEAEAAGLKLSDFLE